MSWFEGDLFGETIGYDVHHEEAEICSFCLCPLPLLMQLQRFLVCLDSLLELQFFRSRFGIDLVDGIESGEGGLQAISTRSHLEFRVLYRTIVLAQTRRTTRKLQRTPSPCVSVLCDAGRGNAWITVLQKQCIGAA